MKVPGDLFNDYTGWLVVGIIVFMMGYLFNMFVSKSSKGE